MALEGGKGMYIREVRGRAGQNPAANQQPEQPSPQQPPLMMAQRFIFSVKHKVV